MAITIALEQTAAVAAGATEPLGSVTGPGVYVPILSVTLPDTDTCEVQVLGANDVADTYLLEAVTLEGRADVGAIAWHGPPYPLYDNTWMLALSVHNLSAASVDAVIQVLRIT